MRSSVDLPQPDGPTKTANSPGIDGEIDAVDDLHVAVALDDLLEDDAGRHVFPPSAGPRRQPARRISGWSGPIGSATSAPRVGGMVERGDDFERAARVGASSPAAARPPSSASWKRAICVVKRGGTCCQSREQRRRSAACDRVVARQDLPGIVARRVGARESLSKVTFSKARRRRLISSGEPRVPVSDAERAALHRARRRCAVLDLDRR